MVYCNLDYYILDFVHRPGPVIEASSL